MSSNKTEVEDNYESVRLENVKQEKQQKSCKNRHSAGAAGEASCPQDFDDVLEMVGSIGNYQRFMLYGIMFPLSVFESVLSINLWFLLDEPNHWCNVPGRNELGISLEEWKNLTIPKYSHFEMYILVIQRAIIFFANPVLKIIIICCNCIQRDENGEFSKCTMFNTSAGSGYAVNDVIECTSGWEYDFSVANYHSILTDYNWVCDKSHWPTLVHTATNTGRAIGTLVLGFLADKIGRKPVFIITLILFSFGRATALFFADNIQMFVALALLTGMSSPMFAISINTIAAELSGKEYRAWIFSFTFMMVVGGLVMVPCIALITPNWFILGWVTISIGSLSYLFLPWLPESPRWLLSRGRIDEVVKILRTVAQWNRTEHKIRDEELHEILNDMSRKVQDGENHGESISKLFSKKRVAILTLLITFTWVMNGLIFHGLNLNSLNLHGHRYLNLVLVVLMEVPGGFFGGLLADKFGRRWMQVLFFLMSGIACSLAAYFSAYAGGAEDSGSFTLPVIVASNAAKFTVTMSFLIIYLQALELFPTPLRTTGSGMASTISSVTVILVPYIVYTGKSSKTTPWIVSSVMSFAGMISSSFIPETLNHNLPETVEEAADFGKNRKFWSFRVPKQNKK